jgi:hypothetical protein
MRRTIYATLTDDELIGFAQAGVCTEPDLIQELAQRLDNALQAMSRLEDGEHT